MQSTTKPMLNLDGVRQTAITNPKFKTLLELFATRQRGRQNTTVSRALRVLRDEGFEGYSKGEVSQFYRELQKAGAGHWMAGRNGKEGRFVWDFHLVSLAQAILEGNQSTKVEPAPKSRVKLPMVDTVQPKAIQEPVAGPVLEIQAEPKPEPIEPAPAKLLPQEPANKVKLEFRGVEIEFPANLKHEEYEELAAFLKKVGG